MDGGWNRGREGDMGEAGAEKLIEYLFLVEFVITCLCEIPKKKKKRERARGKKL